MFKKIAEMKLKKRLTAGYMVVIILMAVSGLLSIISMGTIFSNFEDFVRNTQRADTAVKNCRINVNIAARNIREMVLNDDSTSFAGYEETVNRCLAEIETSLAELKAADVIGESLYQEYESALNAWGKNGYEIIAEIEAGNREGAEKRILEECAPALTQVVELSKKIDVITDEEKMNTIVSTERSVFIGLASIIVFLAVALLVAVKISNVVVKSIISPLKAIEDVVVALSEGNLHNNLDYRSDDEIGSMAHSLRKSSRILASYIEDIGRAMGEFSKGNFDVQPTVEWKGDFVEILDSFMTFEASMADMVKEVQDVADHVKSGSEQIAASSLDLAQSATDQASVTEELTATINTISEQVLRNAESAEEISKEVEKVGTEIINSNGKMAEMVKSMAEISEASNAISKIIAAINDIASQTNLLALNASIEAARAGEAGRGFAVVADQVSVLAAQSAEAAKESAALIDSSVQAVEKGMLIADETAQQLQQVVAGSEKITEDVNGVASVLNEQAAAFAQINEGIEHINDGVQTNSATSEECAAASQEMNSQSTTLESLVRRFKVGKF